MHTIIDVEGRLLYDVLFISDVSLRSFPSVRTGELRPHTMQADPTARLWDCE